MTPTDAVPKKRGPKTDVLEALLKRVNGLEKRLKDENKPISPTDPFEESAIVDAQAEVEASKAKKNDRKLSIVEPRPKQEQAATASIQPAHSTNGYVEPMHRYGSACHYTGQSISDGFVDLSHRQRQPAKPRATVRFSMYTSIVSMASLSTSSTKLPRGKDGKQASSQ